VCVCSPRRLLATQVPRASHPNETGSCKASFMFVRLPLLCVLQESKPSGRRKRKIGLQEGMTMMELTRALDTTQSVCDRKLGGGGVRHTGV